MGSSGVSRGRSGYRRRCLAWSNSPLLPSGSIASPRSRSWPMSRRSKLLRPEGQPHRSIERPTKLHTDAMASELLTVTQAAERLVAEDVIDDLDLRRAKSRVSTAATHEPVALQASRFRPTKGQRSCASARECSAARSWTRRGSRRVGGARPGLGSADSEEPDGLVHHDTPAGGGLPMDDARASDTSEARAAQRRTVIRPRDLFRWLEGSCPTESSAERTLGYSSSPPATGFRMHNEYFRL